MGAKVEALPRNSRISTMEDGFHKYQLDQRGTVNSRECLSLGKKDPRGFQSVGVYIPLEKRVLRRMI